MLSMTAQGYIGLALMLGGVAVFALAVGAIFRNW